MANRITIYGNPRDRDSKRLKREMNVMTLEYDFVDAAKDQRASRLKELGEPAALPVVEVQRPDGLGHVYLTNPDEPTLRQCLYSEGILSITSFWI
jgi:hypothetical protein